MIGIWIIVIRIYIIGSGTFEIGIRLIGIRIIEVRIIANGIGIVIIGSGIY